MRSFLAFAVLSSTLAAPALAQDPAAGEKVFTPCKACHQIGETAKNAVGPVLNGVIGRKVGTVEGYNYSPANKIRFDLGRGNLPRVHQRSEGQGARNEDGVRGGQG